MARVVKTIDVDVPVRTAYNQWTQFEDFPSFMEGVERVEQLDDRRLHWKASVGGKSEEWDAEIREQVPDQKVIWNAIGGKENAGMVTFDSLGPNMTRVNLEMSWDPEGFVENVGDAMGMADRRVEGDLRRFKEFIESRGAETGGWRGTIQNPDTPGGHTMGSGAPDRTGQNP
ncbi:MAG: SRPBCC family protein [Dehalococcoidia bacterium]|nr:SRPBCC family protein [Dehalococcoidia bacterium]